MHVCVCVCVFIIYQYSVLLYFYTARELYDGGNVTAVQTWILEHFPVIEEVFIIVLFLVFFIGMVKFLGR